MSKQKVLVLVGECRSCDYEVQIPVTDEQFEKYQSGELIQNVLPEVSPGDREVLISGICGECFDKMFSSTKMLAQTAEERQPSETSKAEEEDNMKSLRRDSAFNFFSVLHLQRYLQGHNGYVAGGCFKNIFKNTPAKDVDIFFNNKEDFDKAEELFNEDEDYSKIYENENAVGYYDKAKEVAVDLVRSQFLPPDEMIDGFDFTITKFALYREEVKEDDDSDDLFDEKENNEEKTILKKYEPRVVYHEDFFEHLTLNRLVIDGDVADIQFPLNTFDRMLRYAKYGYAPCTGSKAKIVRAINSVSLPDDDKDLFRGFYVGID